MREKKYNYFDMKVYFEIFAQLLHVAQASCFANSCRADDSNELFCCPLRKGPEELGGGWGGNCPFIFWQNQWAQIRSKSCFIKRLLNFPCPPPRFQDLPPSLCMIMKGPGSLVLSVITSDRTLGFYQSSFNQKFFIKR